MAHKLSLREVLPDDDVELAVVEARIWRHGHGDSGIRRVRDRDHQRPRGDLSVFVERELHSGRRVAKRFKDSTQHAAPIAIVKVLRLPKDGGIEARGGSL